MRASIPSACGLMLCLFCPACEKTASLGGMCENEKTLCEEVSTKKDWSALARQEGSFDTYPELEASWTHSKSATAALNPASRLSAAAPGTLWIFEPNELGVRVLGLDDRDELVEHALVELAGAPQGPEAGLSPIALSFDAPGARGPLLLATTWPPCPDSLESNVPCAMTTQQVLTFSADPGAPPRIVASPPALDNIVPSHSGDDLFHAELHLNRYDEQGDLLWRQASAVPSWITPGSGRTPTTSRMQLTIPAIEVLDDDHIAYLPYAGVITPFMIPEYWLLDGSGAVLDVYQLHGVDLMTSALFHTPSGDKLIAGDTRDGDLALVGVRGDDAVSVFIAPREHYTQQLLRGASMDTAGTLYAATRAGGKEDAEQTTLLCRLVGAREGDCFRAPDVPRITDIQATAPNILYTLSDDGSLRRFEFPE